MKVEEKADADDHLPCKADATTNAVPVTKDAGGAHLVRSKEVTETVFVHALWQIGDIEVGVGLVRESLELRVE